MSTMSQNTQMFCVEKLLTSNRLITLPVQLLSLNFTLIGGKETILVSVDLIDSSSRVSTICISHLIFFLLDTHRKISCLSLLPNSLFSRPTKILIEISFLYSFPSRLWRIKAEGEPTLFPRVLSRFHVCSDVSFHSNSLRQKHPLDSLYPFLSWNGKEGNPRASDMFLFVILSSLFSLFPS